MNACMKRTNYEYIKEKTQEMYNIYLATRLLFSFSHSEKLIISILSLKKMCFVLLRDKFPDYVICWFGDVNCPPKSCKPTVFVNFFSDYVKLLVYSNKANKWYFTMNFIKTRKYLNSYVKMLSLK